MKFLSASDGKSVTKLGEDLGEKDLANTANPKLSRKLSYEVATNLKAYINDSLAQARFENIPKPSVQQISDWIDEQSDDDPLVNENSQSIDTHNQTL